MSTEAFRETASTSAIVCGPAGAEMIIEQSVITELVTENIGPPGPPGKDATGDGVTFYDHVQATPATLWTIAHNLGFRPSPTILSTGGAEMRADVRHLSDDVLTVVFLLPTAGSAHLV